MFSVEVKVTGKDVCATASGTSMNQKDAARIASQKVFLELKVKPVCLCKYDFLLLVCLEYMSEMIFGFPSTNLNVVLYLYFILVV